MTRDGALLLVTPEHVPLRFERADLGARFGALTLDLLLQLALMVVLDLVLEFTTTAGEDALSALWLVGFFVLRNFYFVFQEVRWRGRTIGKRKAGLRVVAADGGPLTVGMVLARNLPRELEIFFPLTLLLAPDVFLDSLPGWARWGAVAWILVLACLPFLNRRRARLGDFLAGTLVVTEPKARLLDDLIEDSHEAAKVVEVHFTPEQLSVYGVKELQVLEEILRRPSSDGRDELMMDVAARIRRRIGWRGAPNTPPPHPALFLKAFYAAQRDELEKGLLFGRRREDKERRTRR